MPFSEISRSFFQIKHKLNPSENNIWLRISYWEKMNKSSCFQPLCPKIRFFVHQKRPNTRKLMFMNYIEIIEWKWPKIWIKMNVKIQNPWTLVHRLRYAWPFRNSIYFPLININKTNCQECAMFKNVLLFFSKGFNL